ncbi:MAG: V-type ATP synthase subunit I [Candidatus Kariarchaeaceae archaeon]|jgi:V/A-type H+-transporting ATPase subunit I
MDAHSSETRPLFPKGLSIAKVIAPMKYKRAIVRAIENMGQVEPIEVDPRTGSDDIEVEQRRNQMEGYLQQLNSYIGAFDTELSKPSTPVTIGTSEEDAVSFVKSVVEEKSMRIDEIIKRRDVNTGRISELQSIIELLEKFETLDIKDTAMLRETRHVKTFLGTVFPGVLTRMHWEIDEITDQRYLLIEQDVSKETTLIALSVLHKDADSVNTRLKTFSFSDVVIPKDLDLDGLSIADCEDEIASLEKESEDLNGEMENLAKEVGADLVAAREVTELELQRIRVEQKMRRTRTTCVMWAWIPEESQDEFKTKLHSATEGSANFDFRKGDFDPQFTPSRVENTKFMQPMRGLVTSFGTPGLHEVDPYRFVSIFFPILFGIMFADVGHGLLLFLFGMWAKRKSEKMVEQPKGISSYIYGGANLMIIMGITSFILGFAFNSVFGDETLLWEVPFLVAIFRDTTWDLFFIVEETASGKLEIERDYVGLLVFSFAMGAIVIMTGLLLNLYQLYYYRHSQADWYAGLTLAGTYLSILLTFIFVMVVPALAIVGIILTLANLVATLWIEKRAHGIDGLMLGVDHILALMSNTMSFGRLLAMNTIHFVLAFLPYLFIIGGGSADGINHYVGRGWYLVPGEYGPYILITWIICALLGSLIVVPVETTFSTLQSLRLNWVEFFGKFYKGSGIEFKPVTADRIYTKEG